MKVIARSFLISLIFGTVLTSASNAGFESDIFQYDDLENAKNLHVSLKGTNWEAKEVSEQDISFHQLLFNHKQIMAGFADGQVRTFESTEERLRNMWIPRFQNGHPHGGLTVFNPENKEEKFGHFVAGGGDGPGVSEIAYSYLPEYWGKKIGSGVVETIVQKWAPEVRRIGLGINLDELQDIPIVKAFKCFGGKELERLDATASPSNPGSWKILDKYDFEPAVFKVQNEEPVLDLDNKEEIFKNLEEHVLKLFDISTEISLKIGVRYRLIDPEGKVRTFSKHEKYDRLKYHFERKVK